MSAELDTITPVNALSKVEGDAETREHFIRAATHYDGCWRNHGECAIVYAAQLENEIERIKSILRDYYQVDNFPITELVRETLGDAEAQKLGIVIDADAERQIAKKNGWVEA